MAHHVGWRGLAAALAEATGLAKGGKTAIAAALVIGAVVPVVVSLALSACATPSAPSPVLTFFFDDVPPPGTDRPAAAVAHLPRRPPYKKPPPLAEEIEFADLPPAIDWRARYEALAKNDAGDVDWIRALNDKIIAPKPGIAADAKDAEPTDMDLEYVPEGQPKFKVVFPHRPHTHWLGCPNCHTDIFEMEKGKAKMTMDKLNGGAYCGVCHGKVALPELTNCPACHKAM